MYSSSRYESCDAGPDVCTGTCGVIHPRYGSRSYNCSAQYKTEDTAAAGRYPRHAGHIFHKPEDTGQGQCKSQQCSDHIQEGRRSDERLPVELHSSGGHHGSGHNNTALRIPQDKERLRAESYRRQRGDGAFLRDQQRQYEAPGTFRIKRPCGYGRRYAGTVSGLFRRRHGRWHGGHRSGVGNNRRSDFRYQQPYEKTHSGGAGSCAVQDGHSDSTLYRYAADRSEARIGSYRYHRTVHGYAG